GDQRLVGVFEDALERAVGGGAVGGEHLLPGDLARDRGVQLHDRAHRDRHADRVARQPAVEVRQHQADGLGGPGGGGHDVHTGGAGAAQVAVGAVLQVLFLGVGVHGGHEAVLDAGQVIQHGGQRGQCVRGARGVRDDHVLGGVVDIRVHTIGERDVRVGG